MTTRCVADSSASAARKSRRLHLPSIPNPPTLANSSDATLKINGRQYKVDKLLGEGGFSFVYLIHDTSLGQLFALKKMLVTTGQEGVQQAMREVEMMRRFRHPNIIKLLDSAVQQDESGDGKIIYL